MGTKMAVAFANIFMAKIETQILAGKSTYRPFVFKCFIDDIFCLWDRSREDVQQFIVQCNNHHPTIKFTAEISETETTFLDTNVYKGDRFKTESVLDVKTHFTPTETFQYKEFSTCHPPGVKRMLSQERCTFQSVTAERQRKKSESPTDPSSLPPPSLPNSSCLLHSPKITKEHIFSRAYARVRAPYLFSRQVLVLKIALPDTHCVTFQRRLSRAQPRPLSKMVPVVPQISCEFILFLAFMSCPVAFGNSQKAHIVGIPSIGTSHGLVYAKIGRELARRGYKYSLVVPIWQEKELRESEGSLAWLDVRSYETTITGKDLEKVIIKEAEGKLNITERNNFWKATCESLLQSRDLLESLRKIDLVVCDITSICCAIVADFLKVNRVDLAPIGFVDPYVSFIHNFPSPVTLKLGFLN